MKEKVLVFDSKGTFLKMFKRRFKEELDFMEDSVFNQKVTKESDHVVFVIHNHNELLNFLSQEKRAPNVLVCLFNVQFYRSLSFLGGINNLILFDESKTRAEIFKELKAFFSVKLDSEAVKRTFIPTNVSQKKLQEYYKAMYYLL